MGEKGFSYPVTRARATVRIVMRILDSVDAGLGCCFGGFGADEVMY